MSEAIREGLLFLSLCVFLILAFLFMLRVCLQVLLQVDLQTFQKILHYVAGYLRLSSILSDSVRSLARLFCKVDLKQYSA